MSEVTVSAPSEGRTKQMITETFVEGAKKGFRLGLNNIIPNVLMAYVLIQALEVSGLLDLIGAAFAPIMGVFGLPGEAAAVLVSAWMGTAGGVGVTVGLFGSGALDGSDLLVLTPAIFLMGAQIQYIGRLLATAEVEKRHYPALLIISVVCAFLAMLVMSLVF